MPGQNSGICEQERAWQLYYGIPPHVDTHSAFEDGIMSLSLGSQVTMDFKHPSGRHIPVILNPRSLLIMKGESRYLWTHGITPRKHDIVYKSNMLDNTAESNASSGLTLLERGTRLSLTFRRIKHDPCTCAFPSKCDSQAVGKVPSENEVGLFVPESMNEATALEEEHVYQVYEEIADHFSDTRHTPWPKVKQFLLDLPFGSMVADVGCGNGKYLGVNKDIYKFGSDRSANLAAICQERGHQVLISDCLQLPYRSNSFDAAICIAVIHHLSTVERRISSIEELTRIVRPGGLLLLYVWALEQDEDDKDDCSLSDAVNEGGVPLNSRQNDAEQGKRCPEEINGQSCQERRQILVSQKRNVFEQQDLLVPWHKKADCKSHVIPTDSSATECPDSNENRTTEQVFHRFYHVFKRGELRELCANISNVCVKDEYLDKGNWCIVLEKNKL